MKPERQTHLFTVIAVLSVLVLGVIWMSLHRGSGGLALVEQDRNAVLSQEQLLPGTRPNSDAPTAPPFVADMDQGAPSGISPGVSASATDTKYVSPALLPLVHVSRATLSDAMQAAQEVRRIPLGEADVGAIYEMLATPASAFDMDILQINALKNNLLGSLLSRRPLPPGLGDQMRAMFEAPDMDPVWRNYIVQHLDRYHLARWPGGAKSGDTEHRAFLDFFVGVLEEVQTDAAGTALLAMERLNKEAPVFDLDWLAQESLAIAANPRAKETSRIAALQVASRHAGSDLRPVASELALSGSSVPLRLSAIAALGAVGDAEDLPLLDQLSVDAAKEPRLLPAIDGARTRLALRSGVR